MDLALPRIYRGKCSWWKCCRPCHIQKKCIWRCWIANRQRQALQTHVNRHAWEMLLVLSKFGISWWCFNQLDVLVMQCDAIALGVVDGFLPCEAGALVPTCMVAIPMPMFCLIKWTKPKIDINQVSSPVWRVFSMPRFCGCLPYCIYLLASFAFCLPIIVLVASTSLLHLFVVYQQSGIQSWHLIFGILVAIVRNICRGHARSSQAGIQLQEISRNPRVFRTVCIVKAGQRGLRRTWSSANFIGWFCVGLGAQVSASRQIAGFPQIFSLRGVFCTPSAMHSVFADWRKWFSCQKMRDSGAWIGDLNLGRKSMPSVDSSHMSWAGEHLLSCKLWRPLQYPTTNQVAFNCFSAHFNDADAQQISIKSSRLNG